MRWLCCALAVLLLLSLDAGGSAAWARGGKRGYYGGRTWIRPTFGWSFGAGFGPGFGWPYYDPFFYPYPYFYYPRIVEVPTTPPVYIEKNDVSAASGDRWYFCEPTQDYYPNVKQCSAEWQPIAAEPPNEQPGYWYLCTNPSGYYPYVRSCNAGWIRQNPTASR